MGTWTLHRSRLRGCGWFGGGGKRDRTADLLHAMQALSQLSYTPTANLKLYGRGTSSGKPRARVAADAARAIGYHRARSDRSRSPSTRIRTSDAARTRRCPCPPSARSSTSICPAARSWSPARRAGSAAPLALACAARGATVVLHGRVVRKLEALYDEIVAAGDPQPTILPLDLATRDGRRLRQRRQRAAARSSAGSTGSCTPRRCWARSVRSSTSRSTRGRQLLRVNVARGDGADARDAAAARAPRPTPPSCSRSTRAASDPRAYWGGYAASRPALAALARDARRRMGEPAEPAHQRRRSRARCARRCARDASRRGQVRAAAARGARAALPASARRAAEGRERRAHRRAGVARRSAGVDAARRAAAGAAVAQHDAQPPEVVGRQHVGQHQDRARGRHHGAPSGAPDDRREPRADIRIVEDRRRRRERPSRVGDRDLRSMPTCSSAGDAAAACSARGRERDATRRRAARRTRSAATAAAAARRSAAPSRRARRCAIARAGDRATAAARRAGAAAACIAAHCAARRRARQSAERPSALRPSTAAIRRPLRRPSCPPAAARSRRPYPD